MPHINASVAKYYLLLIILIGLICPSRGANSSRINPRAVLAASDPVIAAVGDIACDPTSSSFNAGNGTSGACRQKYTSDLLINMNPVAVLALGDNQYYCGGYNAFLQAYNLSWGRVKAITHPAVGNHEYLTSGGTDCTSANAGAAGYFNYFGAAAGQPGKGYYSYDIGAWHLIALNSNCGDAGGCSASSPQGQWLEADLNAHSNMCVLAYWHIPLFSSGGRASSNTQSFWQALYNHNADLILSGHDHIYERFAPQTPAGTLDTARGIREFIVGSGGANHTSLATIFANSEVRNVDTFGILKLTLHPTSYDWQFVPETGKTFTDSGTTLCHGQTSDITPPTTPTNLVANAVAPSQVNLAWIASTDNVGVVGYQVFRDNVQIATASTASFSDTGLQPQTTHSYKVVAFDAGGNFSAASNIATATTPAGTAPSSTPISTAIATNTLSANTPTPTTTATLGPSATPTFTPTPVVDPIFSDGFESGSFSAWSSAVTDGSDLSVSPAAALNGSSGLQVVINDNNSIYVTDNTPNLEPRYRTRFYFDPNSIGMADRDSHYLLYGDTDTATPVLRVEFRYSKGNYQLRAAARNDSNGWTNSAWTNIGDAPHSLELDWRAASIAGASDGSLAFWIDGVQVANLSGIANGTRRIDIVQIGAVAEIDAGTRGTYYFDAFESRRASYIGP